MRRYYRRRRSRLDKTSAIIISLPFICGFGFVVIQKIFSLLTDNISLILFSVIVTAMVYIGYAIYKYIDKKSENFIFEHSIAIKKLLEINSHYHFEEVPNLDMQSSYDNEHFYIDISPLDYLIYRLVDEKKDALHAIDTAASNKKVFADYLKAIGEIQEFDKYDTEILPFFEKIRKEKEKKLFGGAKLKPITDLKIKVAINLTNINGVNKDRKYAYFNANEIKQVIERISRKSGTFFMDDEVWQSICRVERGKVTNKIRFAVYNRDGNRCRRCGSTYNLEVDHIYPISKGGKSNFGNLQTLCHACNSLKSNKIEYSATSPNAKQGDHQNSCVYCGAPLILRRGKSGEFYGCSNYPKCRYTKSK